MTTRKPKIADIEPEYEPEQNTNEPEPEPETNPETVTDNLFEIIPDVPKVPKAEREIDENIIRLLNGLKETITEPTTVNLSDSVRALVPKYRRFFKTNGVNIRKVRKSTYFHVSLIADTE